MNSSGADRVLASSAGFEGLDVHDRQRSHPPHRGLGDPDHRDLACRQLVDRRQVGVAAWSPRAPGRRRMVRRRRGPHRAARCGSTSTTACSFATTQRISAGDDGHTEWLLEGFAQRADRHHPLTLSCDTKVCSAVVPTSGRGCPAPARSTRPAGRLRPAAAAGRRRSARRRTAVHHTRPPAQPPHRADRADARTRARVTQIPSPGRQPVVFAACSGPFDGC